jgi:hypothetical protein
MENEKEEALKKLLGQRVYLYFQRNLLEWYDEGTLLYLGSGIYSFTGIMGYGRGKFTVDHVDRINGGKIYLCG